MSNSKNIGAKLLLGILLGLIFSAILYGNISYTFDPEHSWLPMPRNCIAIGTKSIAPDLEKNILSTTARLYLRSWIPLPGENEYEVLSSVAHATVKDGCCLVSHNHFGIPLSLGHGTEKAGVYTDLTITDWRGQKVFAAPLTDFTVMYSSEEVLVLALAEEQNSYWLEDLGFQSAHFSLPKQIDLQSGMKVAQVDWDGRCTRIDWTVVDDIAEFGRSRILKMDDPIRLGASGGGIFYNGSHIANNWMLTLGLGDDGNIVYEHSSAILNDREFLEKCAQ